MAVICLHAYVSGRVQGVWFRQSTKEKSDTLGLMGWVRNLNDGRVEVVASGEEQAVRQLEAWLGSGPELATVAEVESHFIEQTEEYSSFSIE